MEPVLFPCANRRLVVFHSVSSHAAAVKTRDEMIAERNFFKRKAGAFLRIFVFSCFLEKILLGCIPSRRRRLANMY